MHVAQESTNNIAEGNMCVDVIEMSEVPQYLI